jgi:MoaA/NifB/PqqE/SkfB family radical SAM enzyme
MLRWLEISADYRCNCRCVGCHSARGEDSSMSTREVLGILDRGRREGATCLWLGGGEPTLRPDLPKIIGAARRKGYSTVKLQTNGLLLSYPAFTRRLVRAGLTEVNFSLKGPTAAVHDAHTRTPGGFALMLRGIAEVRGHGLDMQGDVLLTRHGLDKLPATIRFFTERGLSRFNVWLFCAVGREDGRYDRLVPRITDAVRAVVAAMDLKLSRRRDFITSVHTPPCTVPRSHRACLFHAADLQMLVTNPGGWTFRVEESPIEGGLYLEGCAKCSARRRCDGLRRDYLRIYGDEEFVPLGRKHA